MAINTEKSQLGVGSGNILSWDTIDKLKEAGFTLGFAYGFTKATPDTNKFKIPRYVMYDTTSVSQLKSYIN